ncbi:hypothetical protein KH5_12960 [Urechidicola sp. KH5]
MKKVSSVTAYLALHLEWIEEFRYLRSLANRTFLKETIKWDAPIYAVNSKNVMGIGALKSIYESFSLSKKREYADHISAVNREATKLSSLEKAIPMIKGGKGLYYKYKNC